MGDGMSDGSYCSRCDMRKNNCVCAEIRERQKQEKIEAMRKAIIELAEAERTLEEAKKSIEPAQQRFDQAKRRVEFLLGLN